MPTSEQWQIPWIVDLLVREAPRSVLDAGAGYGKYGVMVREYTNAARLDAVDANPPAIRSMTASSPATSAIWIDLLPANLEPYDLALFIETIEHFTRRRAGRSSRVSRAEHAACSFRLPGASARRRSRGGRRNPPLGLVPLGVSPRLPHPCAARLPRSLLPLSEGAEDVAVRRRVEQPQAQSVARQQTNAICRLRRSRGQWRTVAG